MKRFCAPGLAAIVIMLSALALPPMASAQTAGPRPGAARPPATPQAPPQPEPPPPSYEPDVLKLSEIIGSLAFLRQLCGGREAQAWRVRMTELLDAEGVTPSRKERLAGAYNRGFKGFALTYRTCTPAAEEAATRLSAEGEKLSKALAGRFGG